MRFWKCFKCENETADDDTIKMSSPGDFEADEPVCPRCKIDGKDPRFRGVIAARVVTHFDPPTIIPGRGERFLACDPKMAVGMGGMSATGDYRLVTCPACKSSDKWTDLSDANRIPAAYRVPVTVAASKPSK